MNRLVAVAVAAVVVLYLFFSSVFIVNVREQAIVMRFGQITAVHTTPGVYFKLPTSLVDTVQIIENRLLRYDIANLTLQVSGGKFYVVDAFLTYRISNPRLFRERALGELRTVEERIATRFDAALRQVYGRRDFNAALSEERPAMMREARDLMVGEMADLGVDIVDVRILRTDLTTQVSAQTYDRMKAERLAEAALLRARGQEQAQTLQAIADRQAVEIVAAAQRDAEIIRGEGDAQRNAIFAAAYGADPEFFDFYRSLEAYRTAMASSGTTMVLSPDSEFFRYFGATAGADVGSATSGAGPSAAAPAAPATAPAPTTDAPAEPAAAAPAADVTEPVTPPAAIDAPALPTLDAPAPAEAGVSAAPAVQPAQ